MEEYKLSDAFCTFASALLKLCPEEQKMVLDILEIIVSSVMDTSASRCYSSSSHASGILFKVKQFYSQSRNHWLLILENK